jgi:hypothetical protein
MRNDSSEGWPKALLPTTEYAVVISVITPVLVLMLAVMADAIVARLQTVVGFLT